MFIDSHAHVASPEFDADREEVIARARDGGIDLILEVGLSGPEGSFENAVALVERHDFMYLAVGVHPHDATTYDAQLEQRLIKLAEHPKVMAWGEIGLDYYYNNSPREVQREAFARQLRVARELSLPVIIHTREAEEDTLASLGEHWGRGRQGIMHCFTGSLDMARECVKLGFHISFSGIVTFKTADALRQVARQVPIERLLIETDCPYLAPAPNRGKRNEPLFVKDVAKQIAEVRDLLPEDIGRITSYNFRSLFEARLKPEHRFQRGRTIVYQIRDSLYINLTNRCTSLCVFCSRVDDPVASAYWLGMTAEEEPTAEEVIQAIGDPSRFRELVFCGYGEPTLKLEELKAVGRYLKSSGAYVRVDTIGHANLIHGRNVVPELVGLVDEFSMSLNAPTREQYEKLVRSDWPEESFDSALQFAREAVRHGFIVTLSVVRLPNLDVEACRQIAERVGARFRVREFVGLTGTEFLAENRQPSPTNISGS
jgi:TatD DNase family protein